MGRSLQTLGRAVLAIGFAGVAACRESSAPRVRLDAVERCDVGIRNASRSRTREDALRVYAAECAPLYEARCRNALLAISAGEENPLMIPLFSCRKAYCPSLSGLGVLACNGDVVGADAVNRAWLELNGAIFRNAGAARLWAPLIKLFNDLALRSPPGQRPTEESQAVVERCERGVDRALELTTRREMLREYYRECASVQVESTCRNAFSTAADSEPGQQLAIVLLGCREAYCPWIPGNDVEACSSEFVPTASAVERAWPALFSAILDIDAKPFKPAITNATLRLYARLPERPPG